jgi:predicted NAD/FAD-dependent oxidoreductase
MIIIGGHKTLFVLQNSHGHGKGFLRKLYKIWVRALKKIRQPLTRLWAGKPGFQMLEETRYTQPSSAAGTGILSSDAKRPGREADHSSPSGTGVKKE